MQIKDAAQASGLPAKTIRYYESLGLLQSERSANGYRRYRDSHVEQMRFLHRARSLGFSLDECRDLLELYSDPGRASAEVRQIAEQHLEEVNAKIERLIALKASLTDLIDRCPGNESSDCAILENLAGDEN